MADALRNVMDFVTFGGVLGLIVWAGRRGRSAARETRGIMREIGRLRVGEREAAAATERLLQLTQLDLPDEYARGFLDGCRRPPDAPTRLTY